MYAIETAGLTKQFHRKRVICDLTMRVRRGDIYGFIGRNGSGKSTTMKMICGLMPPTAGEVRVLGKPCAPCEAPGRVGALIESPGLYPNLSAFDNLMVKALALGVVAPREQCTRLLDAVGLDTGRKKAKGFSTGMKQRLGIALALVGDPDVLLLDEPLSGLDPAGARAIRELIVRLNRDRNMTVVMSSHILDQLERVCTRYGVLRDGRMVHELTAEEVERACASCLRLRCSEPARATAELEQALPGVRITMLPGDVLELDDAADEQRVGAVLMAAGIAVYDLHRTERDIEAFFVELMGGSDADAAEVSRDGARHLAASRDGARRPSRTTPKGR